MTPQQEQKLNEIYDWMLQKKQQQVSYPIDDASLQTILERLTTLTTSGTSATSLTQVYTDSATNTHTGPKAYAGRLLIVSGSTTYEVPYL